MKADLHMHSIHSDGKLTVKELLDYAKRKGLDIISLTDHDSVEGVFEAIEYGKEIGIRVIAGMEMSTVFHDESVHVLAYFPEKIPAEILKFSQDQYISRRNRAYQMAKNLVKIYGLKMNIERLMANPGMLTRGHLIKELILSNPEFDKEYAFKTFLSDDSQAFIPSTKISTPDGVKFLKRNKAIVVYAHPCLLKKNNICDLLQYNVDGIEAIYPKNSLEQEQFFRELAKQENLLVTAGSDYHGIIDFSHEDMATCILEGSDLASFLERMKVNENS